MSERKLFRSTSCSDLIVFGGYVPSEDHLTKTTYPAIIGEVC